MDNKQQWKKYIKMSVCGVLLCLAAFFAVQVYVATVAKDYYVTAETAPNCEAIMVLGAKVYPDGRVSKALQDRLDYALELYKLGKAPKILVSGDHGTKAYDEVNGMKDYLMERGVPRSDIFLDHAGFDTYDSMYRAKKVFGVKTLLISTQEFHMNRALYIARRLGIDAYGYASLNKEEYQMKRLHLRESLAVVKAFLETDIFHAKAKYVGDAIPIMGDGIVTEG